MLSCALAQHGRGLAGGALNLSIVRQKRKLGPREVTWGWGWGHCRSLNEREGHTLHCIHRVQTAVTDPRAPFCRTPALCRQRAQPFRSVLSPHTGPGPTAEEAEAQGAVACPEPGPLLSVTHYLSFPETRPSRLGLRHIRGKCPLCLGGSGEVALHLPSPRQDGKRHRGPISTQDNQTPNHLLI